MTTFIRWLKSEHDTFKAEYSSVVSTESIQECPVENVERTHYLVGSSRVTSANCVRIKELFPGIYVSVDLPGDWETLSDD